MKNTISRSQVAAAQQRYHQFLANVASVESQPIANVAQGDNLQPGQIYLANDAILTQQTFDEPLTTYAVGYKDPNNIEATLNFFAPPVLVPRRFTYKSWTQLEEFLTDPNDLRSIGSEFPTVVFTGSEVHAKTDNRGLRVRVDLDEVADPDSTLAGGLPAYQARIVEKLKRRILRNSLARVIALLSAGAVNSAKTWSSGSPDPDADVANAILAANTASGIRPNKVGFGDSAWLKRFTAYRGELTAGSIASADYNEQKLGDLLMADVLVSRERSSATGSSLSEIMGNLVFLFFTQGTDLEDPSNIKRFVSTPLGGTPIRVYVQQVTSQLVDITVSQYEKAAITSALGLSKLTA